MNRRGRLVGVAQTLQDRVYSANNPAPVVENFGSKAILDAEVSASVIRMIRNYSWLAIYLFTLNLAGAALAETTVPQLSDLEFMTGHWVAPSSDGAEEVWLAAKGGTMTGSFRWVIPNGPHVLEYIIIQETEQGVVPRFKHLRPDYSAWEETPNYYELTETQRGRAVFTYRGDNKRVPERMIYTRPAANKLHFRGESSGEDEPLILKFIRARR